MGERPLRSALTAFVFTLCNVLVAQEREMDYFIGTWSFTGWPSADTTTAPAYVAEWAVEQGLPNASCLTGHVTLNGAVFTRETISYDRADSLFWRVITADDGSFIVLKSHGWEGDRLIWNGHRDTAQGTSELREVVVRLGDRRAQARFEQRSGDSWNVVAVEHLRRAY